MSTKRKFAFTPYEKAVWDAINTLGLYGEFSFTPARVAHVMGRKITRALRQRLGELEQQGYITSFGFYTEAGGLAKGFNLTPKFPVTAQMELPLEGVESDVE